MIRIDRWLPRGFTLIEMLVVVSIVGILSLSVALSVAPDDRRLARAEGERLVALIEAAQQEAQSGRRQIALSFQGDRYAFWTAGEALQLSRSWQPLVDDVLFRSRQMDAGLRLRRIEMEGQPLPEQDMLVFRRGDPPLFRMLFDSSAAGLSIELRSLPNGRVTLHVLDESAR